MGNLSGLRPAERRFQPFSAPLSCHTPSLSSTTCVSSSPSSTTIIAIPRRRLLSERATRLEENPKAKHQRVRKSHVKYERTPHPIVESVRALTDNLRALLDDETISPSSIRELYNKLDSSGHDYQSLAETLLEHLPAAEELQRKGSDLIYHCDAIRVSKSFVTDTCEIDRTNRVRDRVLAKRTKTAAKAVVAARKRNLKAQYAVITQTASVAREHVKGVVKNYRYMKRIHQHQGGLKANSRKRKLGLGH